MDQEKYLPMVAAAVNGILVGSTTTMYYDSGFIIGLKAFVGAIIGGMTSYGTLLSGYSYDWLQRELVRPYILRRLKTDHLDLWQVHDVREDAEIDEIFGPGGAIEAFVEAKAQGKTRFIGVTGHHDPSIIVKYNLSPETIEYPGTKGFLSTVLASLLNLRIETKRLKKINPEASALLMKKASAWTASRFEYYQKLAALIYEK